MSRTVHAIPLLLPPGPHLPSSACPCRPTPATDLLEPSRIVYVHHPFPPKERP